MFCSPFLFPWLRAANCSSCCFLLWLSGNSDCWLWSPSWTPDRQWLLIHSKVNFPTLKRCVDLAKESGSSSWLTVLPILEQGLDQGLHLHKGDFQDALSLHYHGITPSNLSSTCQRGTMVCPFEGFSIIRHTEVWDLTACFSVAYWNLS